MSPSVIRILVAGLLVTRALAAATIEQRVLDLFESKCSSCHEDDQDPELSAKTDLASLRRNDKYVRAGDAAGSSLYKLVTLSPGDKKRMPKSKPSKQLDPLSDDEKKLIADWINGATVPGVAAAHGPASGDDAVAPKSARPFITDAYVGAAVLADLKSMPEPQAANMRYLSLANMFNERDASGNPSYNAEEMVYCRTGVTKLMNSLSMNPNIVPATPVDEHEIVLRFNMQDYGFDPSLWSQVAAAYPYQIRQNLESMAEAERILKALPIMRADFFVFVFAQPPFYHKALGIPGGTGARGADVELETRLGITYDKAILDPQAVRAGFQRSGVSQGNRLIERLPRPDGHYYWKSYDFDPNRQNERGADIFHSPLGPANAALTAHSELKFSHDGGEIVFSLPNRLQGYMLITGLGKRLDEGPVNVVTDRNPDSRGGRIINGISCVRCHADGLFMTGFRDEILGASASLKLDDADRATIKRLHDQARLESLMSADAANYARAVAQCGPAPGGKNEPVNMLYMHFLKALGPGQLAGELGYDKPGIETLLASAPDAEVKTIAGKFSGKAPVPRQDFEKAFPAMVAFLSLGTVAPHDRLALTEFGGNLDNISTQRNESGSEVTVRAPIKNRDVKTIEPEKPDAGAEPGGGPAIRVTRKIVGGVVGDVPRPKIRINADGSVGTTPEEKPQEGRPGEQAPAGKSGRKVIKIETPKPGEPDPADPAPPVRVVKP